MIVWWVSYRKEKLKYSHQNHGRNLSACSAETFDPYSFKINKYIIYESGILVYNKEDWFSELQT